MTVTVAALAPAESPAVETFTVKVDPEIEVVIHVASSDTPKGVLPLSETVELPVVVNDNELGAAETGWLTATLTVIVIEGSPA